jgi:hypothetical protein
MRKWVRFFLTQRRESEGHYRQKRAASYQVGGSAVVGFFVASVAGLKADVAEEARTRGFATPAFAGCALVVADLTAGSATLRCGTAPVKQRRRKHS